MQPTTPHFPRRSAASFAAIVSATALALSLAACEEAEQPTTTPPPPAAPGGTGQAAPTEPGEAPAATPAAAGSAQRLAFPTGDPASSFLLVESIPTDDEIRAGQGYEYQIRVSNISNDLILEDVTIRQTVPENFEVVRAEPEVQTAQQDREAGEEVWRLGMLAPGQTQIISAVGRVEEEGTLDTCIRVSFNPVLCTSVAVVAPELRLIKTAPEAWSLCELIPITYTVTNVGSGTTAPVTVRDPLPEGFIGPEGADEIVVRMEPIPAGESREAQVLVRATRTGELTSRAVATTEAGLEVQSRRTSTVVQQPILALDIQGPEVQYTNTAMRYAFTVTNTGNAPTADTRLQVQIDPDVQVLGPGTVEIGEGVAIVPLDPIEPGGTAEAYLTLVSRIPGEITVAAEALAPCAVGEDAERAVASIATTVQGITSLLLEVVDNNDPVRIGDEAVYEITVVNQGTASDTNVQIVATLPQQLELIEAIGPTDAQVEGTLIRFAPVETLAPGDSVTWYIRATAQTAGDLRFGVELTSDDLTKPAAENEPTRVY